MIPDDQIKTYLEMIDGDMEKLRELIDSVLQEIIKRRLPAEKGIPLLVELMAKMADGDSRLKTAILKEQAERLFEEYEPGSTKQ